MHSAIWPAKLFILGSIDSASLSLVSPCVFAYSLLRSLFILVETLRDHSEEGGSAPMLLYTDSSLIESYLLCWGEWTWWPGGKSCVFTMKRWRSELTKGCLFTI